MEEAVTSCASRVAEKLRGEGLSVTVLTVFLMTNQFKDEPQYNNALTIKLPVATDNTHELIRSALHGIGKVYREGYRYKKAGVMLTGLVSVGDRCKLIYSTTKTAYNPSGSGLLLMRSTNGGELEH
ncbi:MAG: hypothetical protein ABI980_13015 [Nitrospirota bacterium]